MSDAESSTARDAVARRRAAARRVLVPPEPRVAGPRRRSPTASARTSLLLTPQGKLDVDFRARCASATSAWLDSEAGFGDAARGVARAVQDPGEGRDRSTAPAEPWGMLSRSRATRRPDVDAPGTAMRACCRSAGRRRRCRRHRHRGARSTMLERRCAPPRCRPTYEYEALRIEAGVPRLGADLDESTIPQEAFLERDAVSFTRAASSARSSSCRIDTRGHVNRYLRSVRGRRSAAAPPGRESSPATRWSARSRAVPGHRRAAVRPIARSTPRPTRPSTARRAAVELRWDRRRRRGPASSRCARQRVDRLPAHQALDPLVARSPARARDRPGGRDRLRVDVHTSPSSTCAPSWSVQSTP